MQELSRTLSLFLWPITLAFGGFFWSWVTVLWIIDGDPEQVWPRVAALVAALLTYTSVKNRIDAFLGPGLTNFVLFPIRYTAAHAVAFPMVLLSSALLWRVLLLDLLPEWFFWVYAAAIAIWVWPWWTTHFLRIAFTFQVPPTLAWNLAKRLMPLIRAGTLPRIHPRLAGLLRLAQRGAAWAENRARDHERKIEHVSGPRRLSLEEATREALARPSVAGARLGWSVPLPREDGPLGFLLLGAPGVGKSLLLQKLMASVLPWLGEGGDKRALIYDHKGEALALLERFGIDKKRVHLLHPFAKETSVWDIARDLASDTDVKEFTNVVFEVPQEYRSDPFWIHAAELVVQGVIKGLRAIRGDRWTLRDLCLSLQSRERIRQVTQAGPGGIHKLQYMDDPEHQKVFLSVLATMQAQLQDLEPIAKQWHHAEKTLGARRYSLADWIQGSDILVLGNEEGHSRVFSTFNRAFFALAAKRVFDRSQHDEAAHPERTWIFLDEAQNMAKGLDALPRLVNSARGKGVCVVLGIQDIPGLEKLYPKSARSMLNGLSHWAAFRTNNPDTAKWLAEAYGKRRVREKLQRWDRNGVPQDTGERLLDEELVRAEEFMALNQKGRLRAHLKSENLGVWKDELLQAELVTLYGSPSFEEKKLSGPTPFPEAGQMSDWNSTDRRRLGLEEDERDEKDDDDEKYRPHTA